VNQRLGKLVSANGCDGHQAPKYKKWFKAISLSPCPYRRPCPLTPPRHLADALNHGALGGAADPWSPTPSHRSSTVAADTSPSCLIPPPCLALPAPSNAPSSNAATRHPPADLPLWLPRRWRRGPMQGPTAGCASSAAFADVHVSCRL
jgi:hypothetical protein